MDGMHWYARQPPISSPAPTCTTIAHRQHDLSRLDAFKISRGVQRAIGSLMITTPNGAEVHYTMSYAAFCDRMANDPAFAEWFKLIRRDIAAVSNGDRWVGQKPFPFKYVCALGGNFYALLCLCVCWWWARTHFSAPWLTCSGHRPHITPQSVDARVAPAAAACGYH